MTTRIQLQMLSSAMIFVVALSAVQVSVAQDWPQFGGPSRTGKSEETGLINQWPKEGPPLAWKLEGVGTGYSSVAVVGDSIYTLGDEGDGQFVFAVSRSGDKQLWKTKIGTANRTSYAGSRSTPTVDGDKLYVLGTEGDLVCLECSSGKIVWQRNLKTDFKAQLMLAMGRMHWQYSESPLIDGDRVVVTPGARDAAVVALNKNDGSTIWKTAIPDLGSKGVDGTAYSSMVAADIHGKRQYVQLIGRGLIGVDAESGKFLWGYNKIANRIANISSPIVINNRVFVSTGYETGSALVEVNNDGDRWEAKEKYFLNSRVLQNHHGGLIFHEGHVYAGHGHKKGFPVCLDLESGKRAWGPERNRGNGSASVAYADGHIYMRYENGLMVLVQATPEGYQEKGSFMIPNVRNKSWSRPVIAGGKLYLKEQETLYCYDIAGTKG